MYFQPYSVIFNITEVSVLFSLLIILYHFCSKHRNVKFTPTKDSYKKKMDPQWLDSSWVFCSRRSRKLSKLCLIYALRPHSVIFDITEVSVLLSLSTILYHFHFKHRNMKTERDRAFFQSFRILFTPTRDS